MNLGRWITREISSKTCLLFTDLLPKGLQKVGLLNNDLKVEA